jgi:hypothetical protein
MYLNANYFSRKANDKEFKVFNPIFLNIYFVGLGSIHSIQKITDIMNKQWHFCYEIQYPLVFIILRLIFILDNS